jgi:hypothetical protein
MTFLRKSGALLAVLSKASETLARNSFCFYERSQGTYFVATRYLPRTSLKVSETIPRGIPRTYSNSRTANHLFSLIAARTCSTFSVVLVEGLPERGSLATDSRPSLKRPYQFYLDITHCIIAERILNHWNSFRGRMPSFEAKLDADSLICSLDHCNATVTHYTSSRNGVSLQNYYSLGRVNVRACVARSPLTGCKVTSRPRVRFSRYSKYTDTFLTDIENRSLPSPRTVV